MQKLIYTFLLLLAMTPSFSQSFVNPSLEAWAVPGTCETNTPPDGWTNYSNVGLGPDEGTLTICPSTIPPNAADGNTFARCLAGNPTTGEGMYQYVSGFSIGNVYTVSYQFCGTNLWGGSGDCLWHLFLDDVDVNQSIVFSSSNPNWQTNSYTFTATMATHKFGFRAYTPTFNGGGSAAIDNFMLSLSKPTGTPNYFLQGRISVYPNPCSDLLTINLKSEAGTCIFSLFDLTGRKIMQEEFSAYCKINTSMLNSGVYFYELRDSNRVLQRGNVVKK
jgi:hypothetical protein